MERGEKKVGRLMERRLLFSFFFTRCGVTRSKISNRNTKSDTASDNLIQCTKRSCILFFLSENLK